MKTIETKIFLAQLVMLSIAFAATGCESSTSSGSSNQAGQPAQPAQTTQTNQPSVNPLPSGVPSPVETSKAGTDLFAAIREFGGQDNNAMFILPVQKDMQITNVTGQGFLGKAYVSQLDAKTLQNVFSKSSSPMPKPEEEEELLSKYSGSQVLYFNGYSGGELCSEQYTYSFTITGTLQGTEYALLFDVGAKPNPNGDCVFEPISFCYGPTGMFNCSLPER